MIAKTLDFRDRHGRTAKWPWALCAAISIAMSPLLPQPAWADSTSPAADRTVKSAAAATNSATLVTIAKPEDDVAVRPNVLFIAVDDLNDWIGCLGGHPQAVTPNFDRFAKRAVNFRNAHCQAPICNPSRISLLTGMLPSASGVYHLGPHLRQWEGTRNSVTLLQHFQRSGYQTLGGGKIFHVEGPGEFEIYAGRFGGFGPAPPDYNLNCGHVHPLWDWGPYPDEDHELPDHKLTTWACRQLQAPRDRPCFLACGFFRPHVPLYVPQKWFDLYPLESLQLPAHLEDDLTDVPSYGQDLSWSAVAPRHRWMVDNNQWLRATQAYLASISFVDAQLGRLLNVLDEEQRWDDTIVVLWSDHGFHIGTKQRWGKRSLWEASTKVVMMIAAPGLPQGAVCDEPVGLIDLFPTLVDLCGLDSLTGLQGHSLVPLLKSPQQTWRWPALTTFGQHNHAIRSRHFRYITYVDGSEELYDHRTDPHEFVNLANDPAQAATIAWHRRWLPQLNLPMAPGSVHCDARPGSAADIDGEPSFPGRPVRRALETASEPAAGTSVGAPAVLAGEAACDRE